MPNSTSAKSAKAVKAAGKAGGPRAGRSGKSNLPKKREIPWPTIIAAAILIGLIAALAISLVPKYQDQAALNAERERLAAFAPSEQQKDPSERIQGVVKKEYQPSIHIDAPQRVAYDQTPPFGGPHDNIWADCSGAVYDKAIREEHAVHALEHGAVWITYNPSKIDADGIAKLKKRVTDEQSMLISPHPDQQAPISLQSWGHQLTVDKADDERIGQFIAALRTNPFAYPEVGATCANPTFDTKNPPAYESADPGPDATPMDGGGIQPAPSEGSGMGTGGIPGIPSIPGMPGAGQQLPDLGQLGQQAPTGAQGAGTEPQPQGAGQ